jgi:diguanylate cyclase (GGDEF)-like protein/PAS domain S-box-containing protein
VNAGPDGAVDPRIIFVNPAFTRLTGYTAEEVIGRKPGFLQGPGTDPEARARVREAIHARRPVRGQLLNYAKDGRPYWLDMNIVPLSDESGAITHFVAIERDITAQKAAESELSGLASTDELTGLLNRRVFRAELGREIARALRYRQPLALVAVDLDHFKRINDEHGHDAGDAVLVGFAQLARRTVRQVDLICRMGGEEFDILLPNTILEGAVLLAERLAQELRQAKFRCGDAEIGVTASFGVATLSGPEDTVDGILKRADQAMYAAKLAGRDRVCVAGGCILPMVRAS